MIEDNVRPPPVEMLHTCLYGIVRTPSWAETERAVVEQWLTRSPARIYTEHQLDYLVLHGTDPQMGAPCHPPWGLGLL